MTLYLLRHEKRYSDPTYFTSLTDEGISNSKTLIEKIKDIQPDIIISSPFLRCVQTIYPYAESEHKKINIEYSLYEFLEDHAFTQDNYAHTHAELYKAHPEFTSIINEKYCSHIQITDIHYPERTFEQLNNRLLPFINYLFKTYRGSNKTILIVSHQSIVSSIRHYLTTARLAEKDYEFPMGHVEKIVL